MTLTPDDLVELRRIEEVKYRYLRCLDLKRWDELAEVFTGDATASYGGGAWTFTGREAILRFLRESMGSTSMLTSHSVHQPEIALAPDRRTARATWALTDVVVNLEAQVTIRGAAFYDDAYRRDADGWRIAHTGYRRVYEEVLPRESGIRLTADYWGTGGRSRLAPPGV